MGTHLAHIAQISALFKARGVEDIVISPGSRNAPLIQVFTASFKEKCTNLVDERSAAYYALGLALSSQKPVVLICTSGTAALNYAPAVAEAFYQGVPLIVLTADRPPEWIDMQDNQCIHQKNLYGNNCKASYELPIQVSIPGDEWYLNRLLNEAFNKCLADKPGPVQINVPLREPLYDKIEPCKSPRIIEQVTLRCTELPVAQKETIEAAQSILLVIGQNQPNNAVNSYIEALSKNNNLVVLTEPIANLNAKGAIRTLDCIKRIKKQNQERYKPGLIIYLGGQVISKPAKVLFRKFADVEQWYVSEDDILVDVFKGLCVKIKSSTADFLKIIRAYKFKNTKSEYRKQWEQLSDEYTFAQKEFMTKAPFSDFVAISEISKQITPKDVVFAGNSSIIRYLQMFDLPAGKVYANRGTSGIDGCLSTATGIAKNEHNKVLAILGDLSFVYDSNALWNKYLPQNLKVVVVNNQGGGIFRLLEGPGRQEVYEEHFVANHPVAIGKMAEAFGVGYFLAKSSSDIQNIYKQFYTEPGCSILEIESSGIKSESVLKEFNKKLIEI